MSTEGNSYKAVDFGHQDNPPPYYENATSRNEQSLPVMDTTQPTFDLPPSDYLEVLSESQPGGTANPPPPQYPAPSPPQEMVISLPQPNNNRKIFQKPLPMYNPEFSTPQISEPTDLPSPPPTMIPGTLPPLQGPQNCPVPGTMIVNTVQPMVVTTQPTRISTQTPPCKDYLAWSIVNVLFCCFIFGIVALIYSIKTRSAIKQRNWELAMKRSRMSLRFNVSAFILACCFTVIAAVYRLCFYSSSSYNGYSSSSYNGYSSSFYHG